MEKNRAHFIKKFSSEIEEGNAAIFAGAGLSVAAGYVNWKSLLEPIARKLELDIDKEHDLISLAQYHCNETVGGRHELNTLLINQFCDNHCITENHKILARLPIKTFWTTNYDRLIEDSLKDIGKIVDVKYMLEHLTLTKAKRSAIIYKMHGDREHPDKAILTKDDYEKYHKNYVPFITALSGDLVSKTFLFLGFSFTDPNLDYILSRIRVNFNETQRPHYCIFKKVNRLSYKSDEEFYYAKLKQNLSINDLKRFHIETILVEEYGEVTEILEEIENCFRRKTIFISGSAHTYGIWDRLSAEKFIHTMGQTLVNNQHRIVSGFGLGVGSHVIAGGLEEIYQNQGLSLHDQLILRPFPQGKVIQQQWEKYRKDMLSFAGIAIFVFGNKIHDGEIILADGVKKEFELAKEKKLKLIPIGATGFMAEVLWKEMIEKFEEYYIEDEILKKLFFSLGDTTVSLLAHLETVKKIIFRLK